MLAELLYTLGTLISGRAKSHDFLISCNNVPFITNFVVSVTFKKSNAKKNFKQFRKDLISNVNL